LSVMPPLCSPLAAFDMSMNYFKLIQSYSFDACFWHNGGMTVRI